MKSFPSPSRQVTGPLLMLAVALAALTGCQSLPPPTASQEAVQFSIVHTNDTWGYVDPCG